MAGEALLAAIDHVQLGMPAGATALADARSFYIDLLGMREVTKPLQLAGRGGAWFASGSVAVHMGVEPDFRCASKAHPAFTVDLAALRLRLHGAGVAVEEDDSGLPVARCYVRDPFGNRIEFVDKADSGFSLT